MVRSTLPLPGTASPTSSAMAIRTSRGTPSAICGYSAPNPTFSKNPTSTATTPPTTSSSTLARSEPIRDTAAAPTSSPRTSHRSLAPTFPPRDCANSAPSRPIRTAGSPSSGLCQPHPSAARCCAPTCAAARTWKPPSRAARSSRPTSSASTSRSRGPRISSRTLAWAPAPKSPSGPACATCTPDTGTIGFRWPTSRSLPPQPGPTKHARFPPGRIPSGPTACSARSARPATSPSVSENPTSPAPSCPT